MILVFKSDQNFVHFFISAMRVTYPARLTLLFLFLFFNHIINVWSIQIMKLLIIWFFLLACYGLCLEMQVHLWWTECILALGKSITVIAQTLHAVLCKWHVPFLQRISASTWNKLPCT